MPNTVVDRSTFHVSNRIFRLHWFACRVAVIVAFFLDTGVASPFGVDVDSRARENVQVNRYMTNNRIRLPFSTRGTRLDERTVLG